MAPQKELKPPQELVDAVQQSVDMTAPAEFSTGDEFGQAMPRALRNRLVHEELQKPGEHGEGGEVQRISKQELKDHTQEVRLMQYEKERHNRYDRGHPGIGRAGRGDEGISSAANILGDGEMGGHMRYGHD